ncbi:DUF1552 domain-containing protein [Sandaracinus amylolyticus]|uniref:DUF1552 domain-containing protein n=1 Tax=Sandaracinus amylolyticus TaxID=927083 RepID=UPI001F475938|nr:DUF1552 domain-containing protein [Sandaracinus amylolyticus]UJR82328.1 Hypothetical protein I5071_43930 [Sandaracinus amylolyticus]
MKRRDLLRGIGMGAAAAALPFTNLLRARADVPAFPLRFVAIFTPNGTIGDAWGTRSSDTSFTLGSILEPLAPYRAKSIVLDGLDMSVTRVGPGAAHQKGIGALLTGQPLLEGDFCGGGDCDVRAGWAAGESIDQAIATHLDGITRLRSLELGVRVTGSNNRHRVAYRGANDPLPPSDDPFQVFDRLFASAGVDREVLERQRRERQSVLDLARDDLSALHGALGSEHRPRLEAHLESLREVERSLDAALEGGSCAAPDAPARFDHRASDNYPRSSRLMLDVLASALRCDATRVATVLYSGATSEQRFSWLDVAEGHHTLSHEGDGNATAQQKLTRINRWYAQEIAHFLGLLDAIPERDGTMLDHTIVLWGNELSKGNTHSRNDMRLVIAGGGAAGLRGGRWLRYGDRPHNDLLVTIANTFGMEITSFGHRDFNTGPITGL